MFISVIIPTRNRPDLIGNSVTSVLGNTHPEFEVTVVDQSDDTKTRDIVRAHMVSDRRLRYIHTSTSGLSRAYNLGARETCAEVLAFTDDDCVVPSGWLDAIARSFAQHEDADMVYGQVMLPEALTGTADWVPTLTFGEPRKLSAQHGFEVYGMGANFAIRRSAFELIDGFDEVLGGGGPLRSSQDFDLQYRVYRAGGTILLDPTVTVDHYGVRRGDQTPATLEAYGIGDGAFYFKHVRCGDIYALSLLSLRVGRLAVRELLSAVGLRRRPSSAAYIWSCLNGVRQSLRYPVDRRRRMYRLATVAG